MIGSRGSVLVFLLSCYLVSCYLAILVFFFRLFQELFRRGNRNQRRKVEGVYFDLVALIAPKQ